MKRILIVILLSLLGPGLGQIYNKEFKKGFLLLIIASALFLIPSFWVMQKVVPHLPDPNQQIITKEMIQSAAKDSLKGYEKYLNTITLLFFGVWAFAVTDSIFKAKELNQLEKPPEQDQNQE